jgi:hypothetical protein
MEKETKKGGLRRRESREKNLKEETQITAIPATPLPAGARKPEKDLRFQ